MGSPRQEKKDVKNAIMALLNKTNSIALDKVLAQFSLDTGFNKLVIRDIIDDMEIVGYLEVSGNTIIKGKGAISMPGAK